MTLNNIKGEIRRGGITQRRIANSMEMTESNLSLKLNERIPMTVDEAKFIRDRWLKGSTLDYLLESDGNLPSETEKELALINAAVDQLEYKGLADEGIRKFADEMRADAERKTVA